MLREEPRCHRVTRALQRELISLEIFSLFLSRKIQRSFLSLSLSLGVIKDTRRHEIPLNLLLPLPPSSRSKNKRSIKVQFNRKPGARGSHLLLPPRVHTHSPLTPRSFILLVRVHFRLHYTRARDVIQVGSNYAKLEGTRLLF